MKGLAYWGGGLLAMVLFLTPHGVRAAKATHDITYDSGSLATAFWYPDKLELIRGVIVFTGGQNGNMSGDTRAQVDNRFWQRFAESVGFGIVGTQFTGSYTNAANGPGKALLDSLSALAATTGHAELAHAPLLVEGFSNGGYFSFTFTQFAPTRVIAFCLNKSGYAKAPLDAPFLAVPGLLVWGSDEPPGVPTVIHALVEEGRKKHALWAELKEWGVGHQEGAAERAFAPFFADMIAARYPTPATPRTSDVPLIALNEADGWLADHGDKSVESNLPTIGAFAEYSGDKAAASWLPSRAVANLWRGFVTKTPLALALPSAGAQLDASQPLPLSASGLATSETASFFDGSTELVRSVAVSGGQAKSSWQPGWGGVRGIVALAVGAAGVETRVSRPAHVVLYGKDAPPHSAPIDAGVVVEDGGGVRDAAAVSSGPAATDASPAADDAAVAADSGVQLRHEDASVKRAPVDGCCAVRGPGAARSAVGAPFFAVLSLLGWRRRLRSRNRG